MVMLICTALMPMVQYVLEFDSRDSQVPRFGQKSKVRLDSRVAIDREIMIGVRRAIPT